MRYSKGMSTSKQTLKALYSFPGFQALATLKPQMDDHGGQVITLRRRQKKQPAPAAAQRCTAGAIDACTVSVTLTPVKYGYIWNSNTGVYSALCATP